MGTHGEVIPIELAEGNVVAPGPVGVGVGGGTDSGEGAEVVGEMRLVVVAAG